MFKHCYLLKSIRLRYKIQEFSGAYIWNKGGCSLGPQLQWERVASVTKSEKGFIPFEKIPVSVAIALAARILQVNRRLYRVVKQWTNALTLRGKDSAHVLLSHLTSYHFPFESAALTRLSLSVGLYLES